MEEGGETTGHVRKCGAWPDLRRVWRVRILSVLFLPVVLLAPAAGQSSVTTPSGARIEILNTDRLVFDALITPAQRLLGNVRLKHDNALMRCDSAWLFEDQTLFAYGHVSIDQDTLHITGDRLDYNGAQRTATLTGNVSLSDPGMRLTTSSLTYSLRERVARYTTGATIVSTREQNTLTSRNGAYLAGAHRFIFSREVKLTHPDRTIEADTLHYTTTSGVAEFFGPTRITQGTSVMWTERGRYDTRTKRGEFTRRGRIVDGAQELMGDSLHYDQVSGLGRAWGHVCLRDTSSDMIVTGERGTHDRTTGRSTITGAAEMIMLLDEDSLFLHADTLFASKDSLGGRHVQAARHARFFKHDMQGVCDTLEYSDADSLITLIGVPYLWSGTDQISGDHISVQLRDGKAHRLYVVGKAILANAVDSAATDSGTAYFDQITGTRITGLFSGGELRRVTAEGNSRTVYFAVEEGKDSVRAVTGMNRVDCARIEVALDSGQISTLSFITTPDATLYPIAKAPAGEMRMKGFLWNSAERPMSRPDIFRRMGRSALP